MLEEGAVIVPDVQKESLKRGLLLMWCHHQQGRKGNRTSQRAPWTQRTPTAFHRRHKEQTLPGPLITEQRYRILEWGEGGGGGTGKETHLQKEDS